jgi:MarR family transcriptional regulator, organic hydroperoxide resistance regulator
MSKLLKEQTVDYNIKFAWHAISRMYNAQANQYDMTISVGFILLNIDVETGTYSTKIAPQFGLESRSITRTLKNMENDGLILRVQDAQDKRFVRIHLTEKGKQKREIARKVVKKFNFYIQENVDKEKFDIFLEVIQQVGKLVEEIKI